MNPSFPACGSLPTSSDKPRDDHDQPYVYQLGSRF
jgi:hypothetical protein